MHGSYDLRLVALSVVIAILASGAALDLAGRVTAAQGRARVVWLAGGAFAMGLGIWSMHYVGMEALHLPIPVRYHLPTVVLSLLAAVFASAVALFVVSRRSLGAVRLFAGSAVMGAGIALMHYTGMAAMRMAAVLTYDPGLFALSVLIAIAVSLVGLLLAFHLRTDTARAWGLRKVGSSLLMGAAIPAMHYTGMAAARFTPAIAPVDLGGVLSVSSLGVVAVSSSTLLVLALALGTSMVDRHLANQAGALAQLAAIVESSHDAIVATTLDGVIVAWNRGAEQLWGYRATDALGQPISILAQPERGPATASFIARIAAGESIQDYEAVGVRKDGSLVHVSATYSPIRDRTGRVARISGIVRDVTERKRAEEAMRQARDLAERAAAAKSEFLASMSHEIRTPLNGVVGMSGLLLDTPLSPTQRDYAETLRRSAESLLLIINDILDYSKIEAGQLRLEQAPFDLEVVLKDVADLVAAAAQAKGIELAIRVAPDTPRHVVGDVSRIRQVLTNLAGNAVKFTHAGHVLLEVTCEAREDGRARLRFAVQDTGIGIPADKLEHIFERFTQADASTTRRYGGTGLGLAISKQLVELMGGKVAVASEPGAGSTFSFRLLLALSEPPSERVAATLAGIRALVVDDRAVNRRVLEEQIASWRMRTSTAGSAAEALEALRRGQEESDPYQIVLLDYQLPDRDGLSLAQELRVDPAFAHLVLVILSSVGVRPAEQGEGSADAWLVKPVRPSVLYNALVNAVAQRAGGRAPPTRPAEPLVAAALPRLSARVLVAEDNPVNQKVILALLEKLGCRADLASNGSEAVEMLDRFRYDVVLMDCEMPEMDGFQATAAIRRRERDGVAGHRVPIVALTAYAMAGDRERCLAAGMDEYLSKPVRERELATTLARVAGSQSTTTPAAAPSGEPPCDEAALLAQVGGDSQLAREILQIYLSHAPGWLDAIRRAVAAADAVGLARTAHTLKGALSNLAAPAATAAAHALETAGRTGDLGDARQALGRLEAELARLQEALEALQGSLP